MGHHTLFRRKYAIVCHILFPIAEITFKPFQSSAPNPIVCQRISNITWWTVSKEKSKNMPSIYSSFSKEDINLFIRVIKAMYVECIFLNPNWVLFRIAKVSRKSISLSYITFSKTFEMTHSNETGRYLLEKIHHLIYTRESHWQVLIM